MQPAAPTWLAEEAWLRDLLSWCLKRLHDDRRRAVTRRITPRHLPALFDFNQNTGYRWHLLQSLARDHGVFRIQLAPTRTAEEPYQNAQLRLNPDSEALLRVWLNQPRVDPYMLEWSTAIQQQRSVFADQGQALLTNPLQVPGFTASELVNGFVRISDHLDQPCTARHVAARCFAGHSKLLDQRAELLFALFGPRAAAMGPRPLLLNAWAPGVFSQILLVENQDSFLQLVSQPPAECALVYSAGFRASAERLLSAHTRFAFLPGSDSAAFQQHWLSAQPWFWGDLDYAGMAILKALRHSLPRLQAWQPGYQPLLGALLDGAGHRPEQAGKTRQTDPGVTGCDYADQQLLPALRATGRFLDQEWVASIHL
ncbi:Wadjet anti-phage system protein JetD domain-containing protein [Halopseudomonas pelagia]|uniref:Wadjet anti-phage system protein JetD domain-containing protein n=1 Tax=Halopseudomonas pelagia TaxID=553151 RepID=UPI0003A78644|nr:Wadjet anti-phage system protein JetD domain-containing protein [Halopseudomonas pelagia]